MALYELSVPCPKCHANTWKKVTTRRDETGERHETFSCFYCGTDADSFLLRDDQ